MKTKKLIRVDIIDLLHFKENLTARQLNRIYNFINEIDEPRDERLRITDSVKRSNPNVFKDRDYFRNGIEKLVWEEDD